jgi:hypothetical protein
MQTAINNCPVYLGCCDTKELLQPDHLELFCAWGLQWRMIDQDRFLAGTDKGVFQEVGLEPVVRLYCPAVSVYLLQHDNGLAAGH